MSDRTAEFLAEQKRLTEAATPGPWTWAAHTTVDVEAWAVFDPRDWAVADNGDGFKADAEFIAAARSSVPKLIAAVEAALSEHWSEPYAQGPDYCAGCEHRWPCDTYRAIEAALGGEGDGE